MSRDNNHVDTWAEADLAWKLVDATSPSLSAAESAQLYAVLGAGDSYRAITTVLRALVQHAVPLPADLEISGAWNSFYSPELNVHVFHIAGDGRTNGRILLYRHKA